MEPAFLPLLGILLAGYLIGSVPFGLLLTRAAGLGDVRKIGSGNIGATNVLRTGRKGLAAATLLLDAAKGVIAVLLAIHWFGPVFGLVAAVGAVLGHCFPVWLGFKGGKGVATALGVLLAMAWPVGLLACVTWLLVAVALRYSSLAAIVALGAAPAYALWLADGWMALAALVIAALSIARHHENIGRLLAGTESKIGRK